LCGAVPVILADPDDDIALAAATDAGGAKAIVLKDLEKESARLKRLLVDAELDKAILHEAASGCRRRAQLNF
jgi:hypothetical protein